LLLRFFLFQISVPIFEEIEENFSFTEIFPVNLNDFFSLLLSDNSDLWSNVNNSMDYTENTITPWLLSECCSYRQLTFISPIVAVIGPKQTKVQQLQRCRLLDPNHLIVEARSLSKDVPYGDSFVIINRMHIINGPSQQTSTLQIAVNVKFSKFIWGPKALIEKSCIDGVKEFWSKWISLAKEKIKKDAPIIVPTPKISIKKKNIRKKVKRNIENVNNEPNDIDLPIKIQQSTSMLKLNSKEELKTEKQFHPLLWIQALVIFLLIIPFIWAMSSKIAILEQRVSSQTTLSKEFHDQIIFLQTFIEYLSENITGRKSSFKEHAKYWSRPDLVDSSLDDWKKRIDKIYHEIEVSKKFLENAKSLRDIPNLENNSININDTESFFGWKTILMAFIIIGITSMVLLKTEIISWIWK